MTPASEFQRLAGRYIVWWRHTSYAQLSPVEIIYRKVWRYGQVQRKVGSLLITKAVDRVLVSDAWVVDEIPSWPMWGHGTYKDLTPAEFDALYPRSPHAGAT